ncbi:serine protease snake-like [Trichoplusia ni]|uniref:Serine protease snake-like n=1 Tax=Trichoplusia ni TaxID=7111 RepID=A0A7E5WTI2_TRINI|nr:serine protease snake-like [Trichoplusia ni]
MVDRFGLHYFKSHQKAEDKCIEYVIDEQYPCQLQGGMQRYLDDDRNCYAYTPTAVLTVAGGMDAGRGQYPHMTLLGYGDDMESAQWLCGGSLISHRYILTAAHCLHSETSGPLKFIALGILKRSDQENLWHKYNVRKSIPYPEYKPPSKYHDIALVESDKWIKFNHHILPACLNTDDTAEHSIAFGTGWGTTGHRKSLADNLQTVVLSMYTEAECYTYYPEHRNLVDGYNHTTQMCYGDMDGINDTCEGDSGGPLQVHSHLSSCMYTLIGVTSYGRPCGVAGGSGIYTRVSAYISWIEKIVWP